MTELAPLHPSAEWPAGLTGHLDAPADGEEVRGPTFWVRGWAPPVGGGLSRVSVRVDGRRIGLARLGCPRPDLAVVTDHPHAPISGFEFLADAADLPGGGRPAEVGALANGWDGSTVLIGGARIRRGLGTTGAPVEPLIRTAARSGRGSGRVLAVSHGLGYGGAYTFLVDLVRGLVEDHGFGCTVLSLGPAPRGPELEEIGVEVREENQPLLDDPASFDRWAASLLDWVQRGGFGVVLVNSLAAFPGAELAGRAHLPVAWAIHESQGPDGFWDVAYPPGGLHPDVRDGALRRLVEADALVFAAEATRRLYEPGAGRGEVIRYGVEAEGLRRSSPGRDRARVSLDVHQEAVVILCLGLVESRKGQSVLAQAFGRLAEAHPRAVLALVGERAGDPYSDALREHVQRARLQDRIPLIATTPRPVEWLASADVLVCASDVESMPFVVLEAMAMEVPVLATEVYGIPEVLKDGETGYLCAPCDVRALAEGLDRVLSATEEERRGVAARALEVARRRHDPQGAASAWADLLRRLASAPARPAAGVRVRR